MKSRLCLAAAAAVMLAASAADAAFTITVLPSAQAAPAGKFALDFFAQNDQADTSDGINLQAVKIAFTGTNGTKVFFGTFDNGDGTIGVDQYNFGTGTSGTNVTDPGSSNLRIGTRTMGQHAYPNYPGDSDSPITATEAANGLSSWSADYAVLSAQVSVPTPTAPGARFARLVFNTTTPAFYAQVSLAGDQGVASTQTYTVFVPAPIITITPQTVTVDVSPAGLESFGPVVVSVAGTTSPLTNTAIPAQIADNISISGTGNNRVIIGSGFTYADIGIYTITFSADVATQTFTLTVVPEPVALPMLGAMALGLVRRTRSQVP